MTESSYHGVKSDRVYSSPSCGAETVQRLTHHHCPARKGEIRQRQYAVYWVSICQSCNELAVWGNKNFKGLVGYHTEHLTAVYPSVSINQNNVPDRIASIYEEAKRIHHISPNAFAVLVRRALESVCDEKKIKDGILVKRLETLVSQEQFPQSISGITTVIRLIGNVGAHSGADDVSLEQAEVLDDFFRFVIEFVYIVPHRLSKFEESLRISGVMK